MKITELHLIMPRLTPSLNKLIRMHWRERQALNRTWDWEVKAAMRETYQEITFEHPKRMVRIISYRKKISDDDNFVGGLKPLIDALVHNHLLVDDSHKFMILEPRPSQERDLKNQRTEVIITEVKL